MRLEGPPAGFSLSDTFKLWVQASRRRSAGSALRRMKTAIIGEVSQKASSIAAPSSTSLVTMASIWAALAPPNTAGISELQHKQSKKSSAPPSEEHSRGIDRHCSPRHRCLQKRCRRLALGAATASVSVTSVGTAIAWNLILDSLGQPLSRRWIVGRQAEPRTTPGECECGRWSSAA
jgi:hypothetical protein